MRNLRFSTLIFAGLTIVWGCGPEEADDFGFGEWSIPQEMVLSGGVPRDGIPAVDNPQFIGVNEVVTLNDADLVVGFKNGDDVRAYPHEILDWHEIVNDEVSGSNLSLTYCPLTGTALGWNRLIDGQATTFGVSGLLFNTNLLPYDRNSNSIWSQMLTSGVQGEHINRPVELLQIVEMPWGEWKKFYPNSAVLSRQTGFTRNYDRYPYGNYMESNQLYFPVDNMDNRVFGKERVLGVIIDDQAKIYRFESMNQDGTMTLINDQFRGQEIIVIGNESVITAFHTTYSSESSDQVLSSDTPSGFAPVQDEYPVVFIDGQGNRYDIFGEVVDGPNQGRRLAGLESYMGFFFSFGAFFPNPEIFEF